MTFDPRRLPPHGHESFGRAVALLRESGADMRSLVFLTSVQSAHHYTELENGRLVTCRSDTALFVAEQGGACLVPKDYGYGFWGGGGKINSVNSRLFKGKFNLYNYQKPMSDCLQDFLEQDSRLGFFDGEPLYVGSDYNLSHYAGSAYLYPIDVLAAIVDAEKPERIFCVDEAGESLEHYILCHLAADRQIEYDLISGEVSCVG
ncbi:MAG: hypothetical protein JEY79_05725 [Pseudodesulfovibrio sp.]|nr:hypothetical protein [Pseudodesulfovibrio sp.]